MPACMDGGRDGKEERSTSSFQLNPGQSGQRGREEEIRDDKGEMTNSGERQCSDSITV